MVNEETLDLIKHFEGLHDGDLTKVGLQPKMCPAGIWTIGWGHALRSQDGKTFLRGAADKAEAYKRYDNLTEEDADNLLLSDLHYYELEVDRMVKVILTENQRGALVSFAYNVGLGNLGSSTLLVMVNKGLFQRASEEFLKWDKATVNGKKVSLLGLQKRRNAEQALFLKN